MSDRKKLFILTIVIIVSGPALLINSPISYVPMVFVAFFVVISYIYIFAASKFFRITVESKKIKNCERLTETDYKIYIENKSFFVLPRVSFSVIHENEDGQGVRHYEYDFILNPKEKKEINLIMEFPHIGRYRVVVSKIKFCGFIDLLHLKKNTKWNENVFVTPKIYPIKNYRINTTNPMFTVNYNVPYKIRGGEFNDVREYIPGDSIKNIHWKLSAHSNEMFTRIINSDAVSGITVFADFSYREDMDYDERLNVYDCMAEAAYACGIYSMDNDYGISYIYSMQDAPTYFSPSTLEELGDFIYSIPKSTAVQKYSQELLMAEHLNAFICFDNVIVLTSNVHLATAEVLSEYKDRGKYPVLFHIRQKDGEKLTGEVKEVLHKNRIRFFSVSNAQEIAGILGGGFK